MSPLVVIAAFALVIATAYLTVWLVRKRLSEPLGTGQAIAYIATAFAFILGLTLSTASGHFSDARSTAQSEASATTAMLGTAVGLPSAQRQRVQDDIVCVMQSTITDEWPLMQNNNDRGSARTNSLIQALYNDIAALPSSDRQASGLTSAMSARAQLRDQRLLNGAPRVPPPIWVILLVLGFCVVLFIGLRDEYPSRRLWIALSVLLSITILTTTAVLAMLDNPYRDGFPQVPGLTIGPSAMQRSLDMVATYAVSTGRTVPCHA